MDIRVAGISDNVFASCGDNCVSYVDSVKKTYSNISYSKKYLKPFLFACILLLLIKCWFYDGYIRVSDIVACNIPPCGDNYAAYIVSINIPVPKYFYDNLLVHPDIFYHIWGLI